MDDPNASSLAGDSGTPDPGLSDDNAEARRPIVTPEIMLLGDNAKSRIRWTLDREVERLESEIAEHSEVGEMLASNGWDVRMLALGHIFNGLLDLAEFDDEEGRT